MHGASRVMNTEPGRSVAVSMKSKAAAPSGNPYLHAASSLPLLRTPTALDVP